MSRFGLGALRRLARAARSCWEYVADDVIGAGQDLRPEGQGPFCELPDYVRGIDRFNQSQPNAPLLDAIRAYNHTILSDLDRLRHLRGKRLLDLGASPHGYALERALQLGAREYVGIGLDVSEPVEVRARRGVGRLLRMDAARLAFADASFDLVVSLSTFEHVADVPGVLAEIRRALKPGGSALITFEPVWTCSYGHHLHHFGPVSALMPDWAHLLWDKEQMRRELAPVWPAGAALSLEEAVQWTYESGALNRLGVTALREEFAHCGLGIEWLLPMRDQERSPERLQFVAQKTNLPPADLMTKGLSVLLNKQAA
jgi:SAM-dependent methyltransferase